jgi:hypothetical protein
MHREENLLTPILSALTGLVKESRDARRFVKIAVFNDAAITPASSPGGGSGDSGDHKQNTSE